jgi:DNA-binding IclR family transcriptional regulator
MKTLDRFFSIIDVLEKNKKMRLQEIADCLNLDKSTVYRFVTKMSKYKFVEREPETKKYMLGLRFLNISSRIIERLDIKEKSKESLDNLSEITQETIHLGMLWGNEIMYIDKKESNNPIRMYSQVGKTIPIYCTAMGKVILAFQDAEKIEQIINSITFKRNTPNTIVNKEGLLNEIAAVRENGFAIDKEEHENGITCIAASIRDYTQEVIAAISITKILSQYKTEDVIQYKDLIISESKNISRKLGCLF